MLASLVILLLAGDPLDAWGLSESAIMVGLVGFIWCVIASLAAVAELAGRRIERRRRALATLGVNATPVVGLTPSR
jgi:hypothetical protein